MPPNAIYCGQPTRWGNPWVVGAPIETRVMGEQVGAGAGFYRAGAIRGCDMAVPPQVISAVLAVQLYRSDLEDSLARATSGDPGYREMAEALAQLARHDLACWCPLTSPCHVDVILDLANRGRGRKRACHSVTPLIWSGRRRQ